MNRKEWLECDNNEIKWYWRTKCEEIRKTLKYNPDPNATHKHHLFNTPEQIKYNNEHYEMWGFNEDGTFEYGKYIIFVTPEEHSQLHSVSEITKQKIRDSMPDRHGENNPMYGKHWSDEERLQISENMKNVWNNSPKRKLLQSVQMTGECNPMYGVPSPMKGKRHSDETKYKISVANTGRKASNETRKKLSDSHIGITVSEETKRKIGATLKVRWSDDDYKSKMTKSISDSWTDERRKAFGKMQKERWLDEDYRNKVSKRISDSWTDERRKALSDMQKGVSKSPEHRCKISESNKLSWGNDKRRDQAKINNTGEKNPIYGKHLSEEAKAKISNSLKGRKNGPLSKEHCEIISKKAKSRMILLKEAYRNYKESGGEKKWNEFQKLDLEYIKSLVNDSASAFWEGK